jgi:hypothetical protein
MNLPFFPFSRSLPCNPFSINASLNAGIAYTDAKNASIENPTHASRAGTALAFGIGRCRSPGMESVGDLRAAERSGWRMRDVASGRETRGMRIGSLRGGRGTSTSCTGVIVANQTCPRAR